MKNRKREMGLRSFYDHTGIAAHLEKMAAEGWRLERIGSFFWTYCRSEPKQVKYTVSYFPKASDFDPEPTEEQRTFQDFCAHTGWEFVCSSAQMQIFVNEGEDPVPIETDPVLEVYTIHGAAKKAFLPGYFLLLAVSLLDLGLFLYRLFTDPVGVLASDLNLFTGLCWVLVSVLSGAELISYFRWHARAKRAADQGEFLPTRSRVKLQLGSLAVMLLGLLYLFASLTRGSGTGIAFVMGISIAAMFLMMSAVLGAKRLMKRLKFSRGTNRALTILSAFVLSFAVTGGVAWGTVKLLGSGLLDPPDSMTYAYHGHTFPAPYDELPLTVEDLLDVSYDGYIREKTGSGSLLAAQYTGRQHPRFGVEHYVEMPWLDYTITQVKVGFLSEFCWKNLVETRKDAAPGELWIHYEPIEPAPWGADAACRRYWDDDPSEQYLLRYGNRFVEIGFDWPPTPEQMATVGEKLGMTGV